MDTRVCIDGRLIRWYTMEMRIDHNDIRWIINLPEGHGFIERQIISVRIDWTGNRTREFQAQVLVAYFEQLVCLILPEFDVVTPSPSPLEPQQPLTLDELRQFCGGEGGTIVTPRFSSEGGFSWN